MAAQILMNPTYGWRKAGLSFVGKLSADDLCVSLGRAPSLLSCPKHLSTRPCCARKCACTIWQNAKTSIAETFSLEFWTKEVPRFSKFVRRNLFGVAGSLLIGISHGQGGSESHYIHKPRRRLEIVTSGLNIPMCLQYHFHFLDMARRHDIFHSVGLPPIWFLSEVVGSLNLHQELKS